MIRLSSYFMAGLALAAISGQAHAEGSASGSFQISVTVPEVCEIATDTAVLAGPAGYATVNVLEMCNAGRGFQVVASHRALEDDEMVRLDYGGQLSALNGSGFSSVAMRSGPSFEEIPLQIQSNGLRSSLVISIGMMML